VIFEGDENKLTGEILDVKGQGIHGVHDLRRGDLIG